MKTENVTTVGTTLSQPEAIWRAIDELGYQATVTEILEYVRTKFGVTADSPPIQSEEAPQPTAISAPIVVAEPPRAVAPNEPQAEPVRKPAAQRKPPRPRNDAAE